MDGTTILIRSDDATSQTVAGEAVIIHLPTGKYFSLNRVGSELWDMLDGRRTIAELVSIVAEKYAVDEATVTSDVLELGERLVAKQLAEVV